MKKIKRRVYESSSDVNIWCTRLLQQMYENQDKLNEIVEWINGIEARLEEYHEIEKLIKKYEKHSPKVGE